MVNCFYIRFSKLLCLSRAASFQKVHINRYGNGNREQGDTGNRWVWEQTIVVEMGGNENGSESGNGRERQQQN